MAIGSKSQLLIHVPLWIFKNKTRKVKTILEHLFVPESREMLKKCFVLFCSVLFQDEDMSKGPKKQSEKLPVAQTNII
jgi:hypothetical protein